MKTKTNKRGEAQNKHVHNLWPIYWSWNIFMFVLCRLKSHTPTLMHSTGFMSMHRRFHVKHRNVVNQQCPIFNGDLPKPLLKLGHRWAITSKYFTWVKLLIQSVISHSLVVNYCTNYTWLKSSASPHPRFYNERKWGFRDIRLSNISNQS